MVTKRTLDFILFSIILILFLAAIFLIFYYFQNQKNACVSNPLVFGSKQLTKASGYEFFGTGYFRVPLDYKSPIIIFNSTTITIQK